MLIRLFFIAFLVSLPFWWGTNVLEKNLEDYFYAQISQPLQETSELKIPEKPQEPEIDLQVKSALAMKINQAGREKVLFKKDINQPLPIASLTKLMTAVIVLENPEDYNFSQMVTISKTAVARDENFGNLKMGDELSVKDLLHIMLIESSNDAAWALSEVIGVADFVEKMNQKAESLGLFNTHFVNPTGLDPKGLHYNPNSPDFFSHSTAKDLVKLAQYILNQQPIIFEISVKNSYEVLDDLGYPHHLAINKNELLDLSPHITGGKTGYTEEAGGCVLLVLKDENSYFINVILGTASQEARSQEMEKLINWLNL